MEQESNAYSVHLLKERRGPGEVSRPWACGRLQARGRVALPGVKYQERRQPLDCTLEFLPCSELYRPLLELYRPLMEPSGLLGKRMASATWAQAGRQPTGVPLETKQNPSGPL